MLSRRGNSWSKFSDLLVFILQASCEQTVNVTRFCDKEVVAQAKVLTKKVENPQILAFFLAQLKFSVQYLGSLANETSNPFVVVSRNE